MFGFSISKLLFTIVAVMAIWHGFKWLSRYQQIGDDDRNKVGKKNSHRRVPPKARTRKAEPDAEDMTKCPVCETYVSTKSAVSCGRNDCPYPG